MSERERVPLRHVSRDAAGSRLSVESVTAILPEWPGTLVRPQQLIGAGRLLIRRDAGLGDCLMILPALRGAKREHPHLRVAMCVPAGYTSLLAHFGAVDEALPLHAWPAVAASNTVRADLSGYVERHPGGNSVDRITLFAGGLGTNPVMDTSDWHPDAALSARARSWLAGSLGEHRQKPIGICLGGIYPHRSWIQQYVFELAEMLAASGHGVIILDADRGAPRGVIRPMRGTGGVAYAYGLDLALVGQLVANCRVLVSPDTGLLHLAAAVATPFVGIYGAVEPRLRLCHYERYRCLTAGEAVACVPCLEDHRHRDCGLECLRAVTPLRAYEAVEDLLNS